MADDLLATQAIPLSDYEDDETDDESSPKEKKPCAQLNILPQKGYSKASYSVYEGSNVIGRQESCDIHLDVKALSKEHACIEVKSGLHVLYDKGSRNKSRRGKAYLTPEIRYELKNGDLLTFGDVKCIYEFAAPEKEHDDAGSETGSESMLTQDIDDQEIPQTVKVAVEVEDDAISEASSDILQPTQAFAVNAAPAAHDNEVSIDEGVIQAGSSLYVPDSGSGYGSDSDIFNMSGGGRGPSGGEQSTHQEEVEAVPATQSFADDEGFLNLGTSTLACDDFDDPDDPGDGIQITQVFEENKEDQNKAQSDETQVVVETPVSPKKNVKWNLEATQVFSDNTLMVDNDSGETQPVDETLPVGAEKVMDSADADDTLFVPDTQDINDSTQSVDECISMDTTHHLAPKLTSAIDQTQLVDETIQVIEETPDRDMKPKRSFDATQIINADATQVLDDSYVIQETQHTPLSLTRDGTKPFMPNLDTPRTSWDATQILSAFTPDQMDQTQVISEESPFIVPKMPKLADCTQIISDIDQTQVISEEDDRISDFDATQILGSSKKGKFGSRKTTSLADETQVLSDFDATQMIDKDLGMLDATQMIDKDLGMADATQMIDKDLGMADATQMIDKDLGMADATQMIDKDLGMSDATQMIDKDLEMSDATQMIDKDLEMSDATQMIDKDLGMSDATQIINQTFSDAEEDGSSTPARDPNKKTVRVPAEVDETQMIVEEDFVCEADATQAIQDAVADVTPPKSSECVQKITVAADDTQAIDDIDNTQPFVQGEPGEDEEEKTQSFLEAEENEDLTKSNTSSIAHPSGEDQDDAETQEFTTETEKQSTVAKVSEKTSTAAANYVHPDDIATQAYQLDGDDETDDENEDLALAATTVIPETVAYTMIVEDSEEESEEKPEASSKSVIPETVPYPLLVEETQEEEETNPTSKTAIPETIAYPLIADSDLEEEETQPASTSETEVPRTVPYTSLLIVESGDEDEEEVSMLTGRTSTEGPLVEETQKEDKKTNPTSKTVPYTSLLIVDSEDEDEEEVSMLTGRTSTEGPTELQPTIAATVAYKMDVDEDDDETDDELPDLDEPFSTSKPSTSGTASSIGKASAPTPTTSAADKQEEVAMIDDSEEMTQDSDIVPGDVEATQAYALEIEDSSEETDAVTEEEVTEPVKDVAKKDSPGKKRGKAKSPAKGRAAVEKPAPKIVTPTTATDSQPLGRPKRRSAARASLAWGKDPDEETQTKQSQPPPTQSKKSAKASKPSKSKQEAAASTSKPEAIASKSTPETDTSTSKPEPELEAVASTSKPVSDNRISSHKTVDSKEKKDDKSTPSQQEGLNEKKIDEILEQQPDLPAGDVQAESEHTEEDEENSFTVNLVPTSPDKGRKSRRSGVTVGTTVPEKTSTQDALSTDTPQASKTTSASDISQDAKAKEDEPESVLTGKRGRGRPSKIKSPTKSDKKETGQTTTSTQGVLSTDTPSGSKVTSASDITQDAKAKEDEPESVPTGKRGRGRPSNIKTPTKSDKKETGKTTTESTVKRGRGRPSNIKSPTKSDKKATGQTMTSTQDALSTNTPTGSKVTSAGDITQDAKAKEDEPESSQPVPTVKQGRGRPSNVKTPTKSDKKATGQTTTSTQGALSTDTPPGSKVTSAGDITQDAKAQEDEPESSQPVPTVKRGRGRPSNIKSPSKSDKKGTGQTMTLKLGALSADTPTGSKVTSAGDITQDTKAKEGEPESSQPVPTGKRGRGRPSNIKTQNKPDEKGTGQTTTESDSAQQEIKITRASPRKTVSGQDKIPVQAADSEYKAEQPRSPVKGNTRARRSRQDPSPTGSEAKVGSQTACASDSQQTLSQGSTRSSRGGTSGVKPAPEVQEKAAKGKASAKDRASDKKKVSGKEDSTGKGKAAEDDLPPSTSTRRVRQSRWDVSKETTISTKDSLQVPPEATGVRRSTRSSGSRGSTHSHSPANSDSRSISSDRGSRGSAGTRRSNRARKGLEEQSVRNPSSDSSRSRSTESRSGSRQTRSTENASTSRKADPSPSGLSDESGPSSSKSRSSRGRPSKGEIVKKQEDKVTEPAKEAVPIPGNTRSRRSRTDPSPTQESGACKGRSGGDADRKEVNLESSQSSIASTRSSRSRKGDPSPVDSEKDASSQSQSVVSSTRRSGRSVPNTSANPPDTDTKVATAPTRGRSRGASQTRTRRSRQDPSPAGSETQSITDQSELDSQTTTNQSDINSQTTDSQTSATGKSVRGGRRSRPVSPAQKNEHTDKNPDDQTSQTSSRSTRGRKSKDKAPKPADDADDEESSQESQSATRRSARGIVIKKEPDEMPKSTNKKQSKVKDTAAPATDTKPRTIRGKRGAGKESSAAVSDEPRAKRSRVSGKQDQGESSAQSQAVPKVTIKVEDTEENNNSAAFVAPQGRGRRKRRPSEDSQSSSSQHSQTKRIKVEVKTEPKSPQRTSRRSMLSHAAGAGSPGLRAREVKAVRMMFTGIVDDQKAKARIRVLKGLGVELVDSIFECTHLITDKVRRTVKLLCGVARGINIVSPQWLDECASRKVLLDTEPFHLKDKEAEKSYKFDLKASLCKASEQPMLSGYKIHVTNSVLPDPKQMKDIINCAGGEFVAAMPRKAEENLVIVSCPKDESVCKAALAAGIPIVTSEFILTGILRQVVDVKVHQMAATATTKRGRR